MKRWIELVAALYPRKWREEFGEEFAVLLDDVKPRWGVLVNVLGGAVRMQIASGSNWMKVVAAAALAGAIVAGGWSFTIPLQYVSSAMVSVTPQADPLRVTTPEALRQHARARIPEMELAMRSRTELSAIIMGLQLYREERRTMPLEDVIEKMKKDIRMEILPSSDDALAPVAVSIHFSYPDRATAQAVVRALTDSLIERNAWINRAHDSVYLGVWKDVAAMDRTIEAVPPPPPGEIAGVVQSASLPADTIGAGRFRYLTAGTGAGIALGLLIVLALRWPRGVWQLGGFALACCVIGGVVSLAIPARYTSTATMWLSLPVVTEDPLAPLPTATPAADYLRRIVPQILSSERLAAIIRSPRTKLYLKERATSSMEDLVKKMARDVRIEATGPAVPKGWTSAFSVSFSYPDRYQAQLVVTELVTAIADLRHHEKQDEGTVNRTLRVIRSLRADENLYILEPALLPVSSETPRFGIAAGGLVIGLLAGAIALYFRRPRPQILVPQPA